MVRIAREKGGSYYRVSGDTSDELLPLLPLLREVGATRYDSGTAWRVHRLDHARIERAVFALQAPLTTQVRARPVEVRQQQRGDLYHAPRESAVLRGRGLCVECGNPTQAPHHVYCVECRPSRRR